MTCSICSSDLIVDTIQIRKNNSILFSVLYDDGSPKCNYEIYLDKVIDKRKVLLGYLSCFLYYNAYNQIEANRQLELEYGYDELMDRYFRTIRKQPKAVFYLKTNKRTISYYIHRINGPAIIAYNKHMKITNKSYYVNGVNLEEANLPVIKNGRLIGDCDINKIFNIIMNFNREYGLSIYQAFKQQYFL